MAPQSGHKQKVPSTLRALEQRELSQRRGSLQSRKAVLRPVGYVVNVEERRAWWYNVPDHNEQEPQKPHHRGDEK